MTRRSDEDDLAYWYDEPDFQLIRLLLYGTTFPHPLGPRVRRLTDEEEREGRKVLANLLRNVQRPTVYELLSPKKRSLAILREVLHLLAERIDPDYSGPRKIQFTGIKGRLRQSSSKFRICKSVQEHIDKGLSVEDAVAETAERLGLSEDHVFHVWAERPGHKPRRRRRTAP